jgi:hypothetical protein
MDKSTQQNKVLRAQFARLAQAHQANEIDKAEPIPSFKRSVYRQTLQENKRFNKTYAVIL